MKAIDLYALFQRTGSFDIIVSSDVISGYEGYGEEGMRGTITNVVLDTDECIMFEIDYSAYRDHNVSLETSNYSDNKTATQAGIDTSKEKIWLHINDEAMVTTGSNHIYQEYVLERIGSETYLSWLEKKVLALQNRQV